MGVDAGRYSMDAVLRKRGCGGMTTRQALLQALNETQGQPLSGEALAGRLGISRAAVCKAARALRAQGYRIDAASGRGYRLLPGPDPLTREALLAACAAEGWQPAMAEAVPELPSTNLRARQLALAGAPDGTLVLAGGQSQGRGRLGRRFESPAGRGLYMTLLLRPHLPAAEAAGLTGRAAVAVCRAVRRLCRIELAIKWVNDLYLNGKKVGGILTEAAADLEGGLVEFAALGIGLNLTTPPEELGPGLAGLAGSLFPGGPAPCGRCALAAAVCSEFAALGSGFGYLEEYRARSLVLGRYLTVLGLGEPFAARAVEIDEAGRLVVELSGGGRRTLGSGEVQIRPAALGFGPAAGSP